MQVKTISYKRVKSLGNYQTETLEMSAEINDDENPITATENLKKMVNASLFSEPRKSVEEHDNTPF